MARARVPPTPKPAKPKLRPLKFVVQAFVLDEYDADHALNPVELKNEAGITAVQALERFAREFTDKLKELEPPA